MFLIFWKKSFWWKHKGTLFVKQSAWKQYWLLTKFLCCLPMFVSSRVNKGCLWTTQGALTAPPLLCCTQKCYYPHNRVEKMTRKANKIELSLSCTQLVLYIVESILIAFSPEFIHWIFCPVQKKKIIIKFCSYFPKYIKTNSRS